MSYLHCPRLVFTGDFLSDVSTINNDPAHYNNSTFQPTFQDWGPSGTNGWWNPEGGAVFDFKDCNVVQGVYQDGTPVQETGDLYGLIVKGAEGRATGKMVDLDPQMQMVSELWGVRIRILNKENEVLLEGNLKPSGFRDLQRRQQAGIQVNGQPLGGSWPSTLTQLKWGRSTSKNRFFQELRATTQDNKLSVNLNGFGYYYTHAANGRFSLGRMIGAIGPWFEGEPESISPCRRLYGVVNKGSNQRPAIYFGNTNFIVDKGSITIDFGRSFPISDSLGSIAFNQKLILGVSKKPLKNPVSQKIRYIKAADFIKIGAIPYQTGEDWLMQTGGVVTVSKISQTKIKHLAKNQLILMSETSEGKYALIAREAINGLVVKADNFVQRLDSNQSSKVNFYTYQWGRLLPHQEIDIALQKPTAIQTISAQNPIYYVPGNNYPAEGITYDECVTTNEKGHAQMKLHGNEIDKPRWYLPGQMYFLDYQLRNHPTDSAAGMLPDWVNIHLRSHFEIPDNPTWEDIAYEMTQFSNLYPIMSKYFVDLSDPEALIAKKDILIFAFTRDIHDPIYMPATRDLSEAKRKTIIKWLENPIMPDPEAGRIRAMEDQIESMQLEAAALSKAATAMQKKLRELTKAKSGEKQNFEDLESLSF